MPWSWTDEHKIFRLLVRIRRNILIATAVIVLVQIAGFTIVIGLLLR
jgi:hypothetical protein